MLPLWEKGYWSKQCPNKRKALQHLLQMIDAPKLCDIEYRWTTYEQDAILVYYEDSSNENSESS